MDQGHVHQAYAALQKKYSLPSYDLLNQAFELLYITPICHIDFPLRFVRRRMVDKIGMICNFLQTMLQPNPSWLIYLKESSFFTADDRQQMSDLLRQGMQWERESMLLDVDHDEQADARFIKDVFQRWKKFKEQYASLAKKLPEGWKQADNHQPKMKNPYVG